MIFNVPKVQIQDEESFAEWQLEILLMAKNRSPYIAEVLGYCVTENVLSIVMPFYPKGDLFGMLHKYPKKHSNLTMLHSLRMVHRNFDS